MYFGYIREPVTNLVPEATLLFPRVVVINKQPPLSPVVKRKDLPDHILQGQRGDAVANALDKMVHSEQLNIANLMIL